MEALIIMVSYYLFLQSTLKVCLMSLSYLICVWCRNNCMLFSLSRAYSPKSSQSYVICRCHKHITGHHLERATRLDRLRWLWAAVVPQRCHHSLQPLQQQKIGRTHRAWSSSREILSIQCQDRQWWFLENLQQTNFWICEDKYDISCYSWFSDEMGRKYVLQHLIGLGLGLNPPFYLELVRSEFRQKFYIDLFIYSALTRRNHLCLHAAYNSVGGPIIKKTFLVWWSIWH